MARILVVDDEKAWRDLIREELEAEGHEVITTDDFGRTYPNVQNKPLHLVILDIVMPYSGRNILWYLHIHRPSLPVLLYSAYGGYRNYSEFDLARGFVVKSPNMKELRMETERILSEVAA